MLWSGGEIFAGLRASYFLLCLALSASFTPPPTGEGLGIVFLGFVGFTLLVHRRLTLAQQGLFGTLSVSFPTRFTKSHTGLTRAFPVSFILPLWGKAGLTSQLVPANLHEFAHNRLTQRQQGFPHPPLLYHFFSMSAVCQQGEFLRWPLPCFGVSKKPGSLPAFAEIFNLLPHSNRSSSGCLPPEPGWNHHQAEGCHPRSR